MKIALLNLPVDNNYGGNLQRYALMKVLQDMGHDVTHICLYYKVAIKWYKKPFVYVKRFFYKTIGRRSDPLNIEKIKNAQYLSKLDSIMPFYEKYIRHTNICYTIADLRRIADPGDYDVYIVGSDQCWRKAMISFIGWRRYLFDFLKNKRVRRVAYGVSFGKDSCTYTLLDTHDFVKLYRTFYAVSVREESALKILHGMGCSNPMPKLVLDPTLLLDKYEYIRLFENMSYTSLSSGKIFCYVLDMKENIMKTVKKKADDLNVEVVFAGLNDALPISIEMWLRNIYEAAFVITDSYHGTIFSILFGKPFMFCGNERRGNDRVASLFKVLNITNTEEPMVVNKNLDKRKMESLEFLKEALSKA